MGTGDPLRYQEFAPSQPHHVARRKAKPEYSNARFLRIIAATSEFCNLQASQLVQHTGQGLREIRLAHAEHLMILVSGKEEPELQFVDHGCPAHRDKIAQACVTPNTGFFIWFHSF